MGLASHTPFFPLEILCLMVKCACGARAGWRPLRWRATGWPVAAQSSRSECQHVLVPTAFGPKGTLQYGRLACLRRRVHATVNEKNVREIVPFEGKVSTSVKVVQGGAGGARVAETRSKRAGWRTLGVQNARSMGTGRVGARGRSHNCLFVSDFVARLAHRLTGFSSMDTSCPLPRVH